MYRHSVMVTFRMAQKARRQSSEAKEARILNENPFRRHSDQAEGKAFLFKK